MLQTSEIQLSSLQQGGRGPPGFQHFKGRAMLEMWFSLPHAAPAPPGLRELVLPSLPPAHAGAPEQTDGN